MDALHRTGGYAQVTAGAFTGNHGMHLFGGAENRIDRARLNAQGAADTYLFVFSSENWRRPQEEVGLLMGLFMTALDQQVRQGLYGHFPTRRALVDVGLAGGDGLGIGAAAGVGALPTLCLR